MAEAIEMPVNHTPDPALMDINRTGDIDGIDTTTMIKKGSRIPVVSPTSHSDGQTLERAKATNHDGLSRSP